MDKKEFKKGEIIIYKTSKNEVELNVQFKDETVWLNTHQMATLFNVDRTGIVRHVNNTYKTGELSKNSTCAKIAQVAKDGKVRTIDFYNLDMIISVGYRVNSKQATQFRVWATKVLKTYLLQGYAINEKRLIDTKNNFKQLQETISFLKEKSRHKLLDGKGQEMLDLLSQYSKTLTLLDEYDHDKLKIVSGEIGKFVFEYDEANKIIKELKIKIAGKSGDLFGQEYPGKFESIIKNLYQTFNKKELYRSIEEKAAHLLYLTIKDHPFADGNKRIAAFLFVYFLDHNNYLFKKTGERKINDNALVSLTLLIAISNPKEKDVMVKIVTNLIK
ncbi:type II toxin-antitoxin system death-on-curing family toxin [bacterium]|nr:MAG: type II toxin-antitoxin system death-on-curing family toxin [bacterium]